MGKKPNAFAEFVKTHLRQQGLCCQRAAKAMGIEYTNFRAYLQRQRFPPDRLPELAGLMGVTVAEVRVTGVEDVATQMTPGEYHDDIMPLIRAVAQSNRQTLSGVQF